MQLSRNTSVAVLMATTLAVLSVIRADAKTVAFSGTMKTQADFGRTFTVNVGEPLKSLTLSIPMPQSGSVFGFEESMGQPNIQSSVPSTRESDITDNYGNTLHIMEFENVPPCSLTIQVDVKGVVLASDLDVALPSSPFPVTGVTDDVAACLQPTENSQSDNDDIRTLAHTITTGAADETAAALAISRWMIENIPYDTDTDSAAFGRMPATTALERHKAKCDGLANLYIALARASGIPARYAGGYWITPQISYTGGVSARQQVNINYMHAWVELWFPGAGWVPYEPQQTAGFVDSHHLRVWQVPDSALTIKTLKFTGTSAAKPPVELKLGYAFDNITDTIALAASAADDVPTTAKDDAVAKPTDDVAAKPTDDAAKTADHPAVRSLFIRK